MVIPVRPFLIYILRTGSRAHALLEGLDRRKQNARNTISRHRAVILCFIAKKTTFRFKTVDCDNAA